MLQYLLVSNLKINLIFLNYQIFLKQEMEIQQ